MSGYAIHGHGNLRRTANMFMYEKKLPFGEPLFFNGKYEDDKVYNLYIQMITCSFKIKKNKIPTIQIKHNLNYKSNEYLESSNR